MNIKKSQYTPERNSEISFSILSVLTEAIEALTIDEIKAGSMNLTAVSTQKMGRTLTDLNEKGLVKKTKSKAKGNKMVYAAVNRLEDDGYNMNTFVC